MVKLSKTSKLDGIYSWSLQAGETCPGAKGAQVCAGCYAMSGNYRFSNVRQPRAFNHEDWKRPEWADEMVKALEPMRYFRWFDSGDIYTVRLAEKILEVCQRTPWVRHWIPTRSYKFAKFAAVFSELAALDNVALRFSSDDIGKFEPGLHGSVVITEPMDGVNTCHAYEPQNAGKCNGCRACWDKSVSVIGYVAHGKTMLKNIREAA
jgi:Gene product 88